MTSRLVLVLSLAAACSGTRRGDAPRPSADSQPASADAAGDSTMSAPDLTATSHALEPRAELVAWLDANGGSRDIGGPPRLRLPVVVTMDADRLGITGATLGTADGLALTLDDTALGIALKDRVRQKCPADGAGCRVWIEGTWRGVADGKGVIGVLKFGGVIAADAPADRVEIIPS